MLNFMKIHPVGAELFYADGRTIRRDEINSRFSMRSDGRTVRHDETNSRFSMRSDGRTDGQT
jgi:hypothetical protein